MELKNHTSAVVALALSLLSIAVLWGATQNQIKSQGVDIHELKEFKTEAVDRMARVETTVTAIDRKIDIILRSHR